MNVLLLGAGASKAYEGSSTGLRMPIASDFFSTFERLPNFSNPWVLREALWEYLHTTRSGDPDSYLRRGIDIEDIHSEIEEALHQVSVSGSQLEKIFAFRPYNELTFIFASVINDIQNGSLSEPHRLLADRLTPDDIVLTFNWDTLMDRALHHTGHWSTNYGYGFRPKSIFRGQWVAGEEIDAQKAPLLLKLHGSSNWLTSHPVSDKGMFVPVQAAAPDTVWVFEHSDVPYNCYAGRYMPGYAPFSYGYYPPNIMDDQGKAIPEGHLLIRVRAKVPWKPEGTAGSHGLVSAPLIIPPVRQKKYDTYGALFSQIWSKAEDNLTTADHIIIIGYSFPRTDLKSRDLFIHALMKRKSIPLVSVLDPNPEPIVSTINLQFGIPRSHIRVHKAYFGPNYDLDALFAP